MSLLERMQKRDLREAKAAARRAIGLGLAVFAVCGGLLALFAVWALIVPNPPVWVRVIGRLVKLGLTVLIGMAGAGLIVSFQALRKLINLRKLERQSKSSGPAVDQERTPKSKSSDTLIPLEEAQEILCAFGVAADPKTLRRLSRDDGIPNTDFEELLQESVLVLRLDWRESLSDAVKRIIGQLAQFGIKAQAAFKAEGTEGIFRAGDQKARIKYSPSDWESDFDRVIGTVNRLVGRKVHYRKFCSCEGTDGWWYAVLRNKDWEPLEDKAGVALGITFAEVKS